MKQSSGAEVQNIFPDPSRSVESQDTLALFAMCLFGEARGESDAAQQAVARVLVNRAKFAHAVFGSKKGASFEDNLRSVILHPRQFSSLDPSDPNYGKLLHPIEGEAPEVWERCVQCAQAALQEMESADTLTLNSDHYFDSSIQPPAWAYPTKQTVKIGSFRFYRLYLPPFDAHSGSSASKPESSGDQRASSAPPAQALEHSIEGASENSSGSCLNATGSESEGGRHAQIHGAVPAPENHILRPHMSLSAPTSPSARNSGPRSYLRYGRSRRLSPLFAVLGLCAVLVGCSNFEKAAYTVLSVTQAEYQAVQQHMVDAEMRGLLTDQQWNVFQSAGDRFVAAHNATVDAIAVWSATKSSQNSAKLQSMLDSLPALIQEINGLVQSFQTSPSGPPAGTQAGSTPPAKL